jgi:hypothetical protein
MGIRIHKVLGYGLTGPLAELEEVVNLDEDYLEGLWELDAADYLKFLETKYQITEDYTAEDVINSGVDDGSTILTFMRLATDKEKFPAWKRLHVSEELEDGSAAVVMLPQAYAKEWYRNDDSIDYTEFTYMLEQDPTADIRDDVKVLQSSPFPFSGQYMNARTGELLTPSGIASELKWLHGESNSTDTKVLQAREKMAVKAGFESSEDYRKNTAPYIPQDIRNQVEWMGFLKNPSDVLRLRPMILTYWA